MSLPPTPKGSWISKELKNVYGNRRWKAGKGVDLNGNGRLEKNEKIATYNTNKIPGNDKTVIGDWTDWLAFYRANYKTIHAKTARNKNSIFFWAAKLKKTNPLHIITSIESLVVKQAHVLTAYKKTWAIIARARKIPIKGSTKLKRAKSKLLAMHTAMIRSGITLKIQYDNPIFITNINKDVLDCDTASFIILAEAHEKGWPVFGVNAPNHFFVRWDDKRSRIRFNMDSNYKNRFPTDGDYTKNLRISSRAISAGVYLRNLTLAALVSMILSNRASVYKSLGKHLERIRDYTKAIKLYSKDSLPYHNRGLAYVALGQYKLAVTDFTSAIKLDPNDSMTYLNRGTAYVHLRKHKLAIKDFLKSIKADPKNPLPHFNYAAVSFLNKRFGIAISAFKKTLSLIKKSNPLYKHVLSSLESAYFKRGVKRVKARNFVGAIKDFRNVLKLNPKNSLASYLIKKYTVCIRNPRRCP